LLELVGGKDHATLLIYHLLLLLLELISICIIELKVNILDVTEALGEDFFILEML